MRLGGFKSFFGWNLTPNVIRHPLAATLRSNMRQSVPAESCSATRCRAGKIEPFRLPENASSGEATWYCP